MAEQDTSQEKTEQPTPKKLREAQQKGQVPRSRELNSMSIMVLGAAGLLLLGGFMLGSLSEMMSRGFVLSRSEIMDSTTIFTRFETAILDALGSIFP